MSATRNTGKVILAGAGPGDAELITVKLQRRLAEAEVIITDRLVNPAIISAHAPKGVTVLLAGKQGYSDNSFSQEEVTALIIEYALQGKTVLRLKGGDIAFFSNVLDELNAIVKNKIPYEIIPGITAASGASAYAGIPLTARGYSQGVRFLTFTPGSHYTPGTWKELAGTSDTLLIYMAIKNIENLAALLLRYSKRPDTALAVIEQAATKYQQVHLTTLASCKADFSGKIFSSPSLVIIGEVVTLHERFKWYEAVAEAGSIFQEL